MNIEDQMEISALMGIPLADLADKTSDFVLKVHKLVRKETDGPRCAVIMMAIAFLYHVQIGTEEEGDLFAEAQKVILLASELLHLSLEHKV